MQGSKVINIPKLADPDYRKGFIRAVILDGAIKKGLLQENRIIEGWDGKHLPTLFADIHFFLVSMTLVMDSLLSLKSLHKTDPVLNEIYKHHLPELEDLNKFRDHLEHITDGRIDGKDKKGLPLKNPTMLGNLINGEYDFGGETFDVKKAFLLNRTIQKKIREWNQKRFKYPISY